MFNEKTPLLLSFQYRNNNLIGGFGIRGRTIHRRLLILIGCVGIVGIVVTLCFIPTGQPLDQSVPLILRNVRSTNSNLTVKYVRDLAQKVGSTAFDSSLRTDEICSTDGCLESATRLLNSINFSINPCEDFFQFACGRWIAENKIPESSSRWSQFNMLREEVNQITQQILTEEKEDPDDPKPVNQAKDFYKGCIDVDALEAVGVKPIRDILQLPDHGDWPILIGSKWNQNSFNWISTIAYLRRTFLDTVILSVYVDQDLKNSDIYAIYIDQPSLVLPRDILINTDGSYDDIHEAYQEYIIGIVGELATPSNDDQLDPTKIKTEASDIIKFEVELAKITTKDEVRTDTERMYNPFTIQEYQLITDQYGDLTPHLGFGLSWYNFLTSIFQTSGIKLTAQNRIVVLETQYIQHLVQLLLVTEPRTIANYLQMRYVTSLASETTKKMRDISFKLNQFLTGANEPETREKRCADSSNNGFGMAIGVKYIVATDFDEEAKSEVNSMVEDLRVSFKELLNEASWMDNGTKSIALDKADKMTSFMAYPDWLRNKSAVETFYGNLEISPSNHFQSLTKLSSWTGNKALQNLGKPVDREYWLTYPGVVNAFYAPTYNSITFPAAILQTPFFKRGAPSYLNYGGIGVVIGHEITHGFDNAGRQYDGDGNTSPWWSNKTLVQYTEKANCIRDQYNAYKPSEVDLNVNGLLTLGENIADNGGVRESYLAYKRYVAKNGPEQPLPGLEKFDPEQLFFIGYANIWCEAITVEGLTNQLLTDPHSPGRFRVRGPLSNNVEFGKKWECPVGSSMTPDPQQQCILW